DETEVLVGFVPLPYQPEHDAIPVSTPPTGFDSLRTIAVSRIYLDNFDHITAYWVGMGLKLAQVALSYGADDLHGTILEEHIFHMAGATSPQLQTEAEMVKAIREAGRVPVQRNTFYEPIPVSPELANGSVWQDVCRYGGKPAESRKLETAGGQFDGRRLVNEVQPKYYRARAVTVFAPALDSLQWASFDSPPHPSADRGCQPD